MSAGVAALVIAGVLVAPLATAVTPNGLTWGMNVAAVGPLTEAGAKPDHAMYWVGPWSEGKWDTVRNTFLKLKAAGVTPVVQWYYWGDDISPDCVENGCYSSLHGAHKSRDKWFSMAHTLSSVVNETMGGAPIIIIVETEFNKRGIDDPSYAPTFDSYLLQQHDILHQAPGVKIVTGFGGWGEERWTNFPKTVETSDYLGFQALRSSVRHTKDTYLAAPQQLLDLASTLNAKFPGKALFITDMGFSSYPEPEFAEYQRQVLAEFFTRLDEFKAKGVKGFMYRSLFDVDMDTANYHGEAERWWGLKHMDGSAKPSYQVWFDGVGGTPPPLPPALAAPRFLEAEAMTATTGGKQKDSKASGGYAWNVWSNGELREWLVSDSGGTFEFTVRARGSVASGGWPVMVAYVGDNEIARFDVASTAYADYRFKADLASRTNTSLRVAFVNDHRTSTEDRNLIVDSVDVAASSVVNQPPTASFTVTSSGLSATTDASASSDPEGKALSFAWDFGDGWTSTGATVTHQYALDGTYTITLTATDPLGASATATRTVTVTRPNTAPAPAFSCATKDLRASCDASATLDAEGDPVTFAWTFGDGATGTGAFPVHDYSAGGTFTVTLTATDDRGASASATKSVTVNRAPVASFTVAADGLSIFADAAASSDADGDALTYAWTWGDGTADVGAVATHAYAKAGTYSVSLTVRDGRDSSTTTRTVSVATSGLAYFPSVLEAESFAEKSTGGRYWDREASGSYGWNIWADGEIRNALKVETPGAYILKVRARGSPASGVDALMEVRLNGVTLATFSVPKGYAEYDVGLTLPADSPKTLAVAFVNDYHDSSTGEDRNLLVDRVALRPAGEFILREVEDFPYKSTGGRGTDAGASAGAFWNLWANGFARETVTVSADAEYVLTVRARGDPAAGGWPHMVLEVDGATLATWTVASSAWADYVVKTPLTAGDHDVKIRFTNDYYSKSTGEDRNLHVDALTVRAG